MRETVISAIKNLKQGEAVSSGGLTFIPLLQNNEAGEEYISLREAMHRHAISVTEISAAGSVPELLVMNEGDVAVLILDGEELVGAKQNRVVNTTILAPAKSKIKAPVSCTEAGRWSYVSSRFDDSNEVMAREARRSKMQSVSASLRQNAGARSNQGQVWDEIAALHAKLGTQSATAAMKDAYQARESDLRRRQASFALVPGQCGFVAFRKSRPLGLELVSRPSVYRDVHDKLVRSYVVDLLGDDADERNSSPECDAGKFLAEITQLEESQHASAGKGEDMRYTGPYACGSALVAGDTTVHAAFFTSEGVESTGGARRRRYI